jgi:hypothetical protein
MTLAKVSELYRVGLGVPDIEAAATFYEKNWRMELV